MHICLVTVIYSELKMNRNFNTNDRCVRSFLGLWLGFVLCISNVNAAVIKTDIVMIVDESGSMSTIHDSLGAGISTFANTLQTGGLDIQFALIGYGFAGDSIRLISDFVDAADFATATNDLVSLGASEPAYDATAYSLDALNSEQANLSFRDDAVKNLILFADEASNSDTEFDAPSLDALLQSSSSLFNVVVSGNYTELIDLALNNGGQSFDLNRLDTTDTAEIESFTAEFAQVKLTETQDFCLDNPNHPACNGSDPVPTPSTLSLLMVCTAWMVRRTIFIDGVKA